MLNKLPFILRIDFLILLNHPQIVLTDISHFLNLILSHDDIMNAINIIHPVNSNNELLPTIYEAILDTKKMAWNQQFDFYAPNIAGLNYNL